MIRELGEQGICWLNTCLSNCDDCWKNTSGRENPLFKNGDHKDCSSYSSITLSSLPEVKTSVIRKALEDLKKKFSFPEYPTTNAYTLFLKENASELKQNAGINKFSMKQLANKWRSMPEAEKNKLRERIMMAKSSYNDTLTKWKNTMQAKKLGNVVQQIDELTRSAAMRGKFQELYLNMELERLQKQYNYPELKRHSPLSLYLHELKTKTKPSEMSRDFLKTSVLKWKALSDEMRARFVDKATRLNSENRALLQKWKESMEKQNLNAVVQQIAQLRRELRAASRDEEVQSKHKVDSTVMENLLAASMKGSSTTVSAP
ncbi:unnamed protein product [Soboliphyme baturini]|uniref:HMG box domain-containing protein n=1 Tax=Soboliphyme baturini TaxID=241478 RepID=A0A183IQ04_9BILA|nr:unnamed protein product [Soboliphyme baturini]